MESSEITNTRTIVIVKTYGGKKFFLRSKKLFIKHLRPRSVIN